jgi:hypothetical protein
VLEDCVPFFQASERAAALQHVKLRLRASVLNEHAKEWFLISGESLSHGFMSFTYPPGEPIVRAPAETVARY